MKNLFFILSRWKFKSFLLKYHCSLFESFSKNQPTNFTTIKLFIMDLSCMMAGPVAERLPETKPFTENDV